MKCFLFFYAPRCFPSRAVVVNTENLPGEAFEELSYISSFGGWACHDNSMEINVDTLHVKEPHKPTEKLQQLLFKWSRYCEDSPAFYDMLPDFILEAKHYYLLKELGKDPKEVFTKLRDTISDLAGAFFYQE